jgi:hypothetical protein
LISGASSFASSAVKAVASLLARFSSAALSSSRRLRRNRATAPSFGERIEGTDQFGVPVVHHFAQLPLKNLDKPLAVGWAQLLEQGAGLADLASERLREDAVLRAEVLVQKAGKYSLVIHEGSETLGNLAVLRIEEAREDGGDRLLLTLNVGPKVAVDVLDQGLPDILQASLLRL